MPAATLQALTLAVTRPWLHCDQRPTTLQGAHSQLPHEPHHSTPQAALACFGAAMPACADPAPKLTLARRLLGMLLGDGGTDAARTSAGRALAAAGADEATAMAIPLRALVDAGEPLELRLQNPFRPAGDAEGAPPLFAGADLRQATPNRDVRGDQPSHLVGYAPIPGASGVTGGVGDVDDVDGDERPRWLFRAFDSATRRVHLIMAGLLLSTLVAGGMWVVSQFAR